MDKEQKGSPFYTGHVLCLPFVSQGHINPMLQFAKRLASKGLKTTLVTPLHFSKSLHLKACNVNLETISDGFDETGPIGDPNWDFDEWYREVYLRSLKDVGSRTLAELINRHNSFSSREYEPVTCLVSDSILPWALDVGKQLGLMTAALFTQSFSVSSIFYHVKQGSLSIPVKEPIVSLPALPKLALEEFPTSLVILEDTSLGLLLGQFSNVNKADWLLFNTFHRLESEVLKLMGELFRVQTIGPTTPSMYLDKRVDGDTENSLDMFKPSDAPYMSWLNTKGTGSVLYISFGSIAELGKEQMEELICGIKLTKKDFLWVVRETEQCKLPDDFVEKMLDKGLIVPWCSQLEVLAHKAIGCFLTHCGWNSTMEALSLGVPMVAMPYIWDQTTNAKFIEDVWLVGIRVKKDETGFVKRDEFHLCIREVMEGERGKFFKTNASRWRELAKDAVEVNGSSDIDIEEFVASIRPR